MLRTRFTEQFDLTHPIMSAPMAMHSGGRLAAGVSAAGALGSFGGIRRTEGPQWVTEQVATVRATTDRPFAIGFITAFLPGTEGYFDAALAARPAAIVLSFGDPSPWIQRCHAAGALVISQVQSFADADLAVAAGADLLVAQGTDAGGHTGTMGGLPLLTGVVARHPAIPVLAAGGIADGPTVAAALTAGADGVLLGTAFLVTPEAVEVGDDDKRFIVESDGSDTVLTRAYDIASGLPWPRPIAERVRRTEFTDDWFEREAELRSQPTPAAPPTGEHPYGQSAAFVTARRPAGDVVRAISGAAEAVLRNRPAELIS